MMREWVEAMFESYPNFKDCSLQTFDDSKIWNQSLARIFENKEDNYTLLDQLEKDGAGIFFSVNSMKKWKRDQESVIWINVWITEIDWMDKKDQLRLVELSPIKPSMIIESKNSLHLYWFAKDWTEEKRNYICNWLRNFFDGDPAVVDISRVLRLPWYYHQKNKSDKFLIEVLEANRIFYTEKEMLNAFKDNRSIPEIKQSIVQKETILRQSFNDDYFWERIKAIDSKIVLERLSWSSLVNWESFSFKRNSSWEYQIYVNWKSTWKRIDSKWKIGAVWHRTNWVFWYWNCNWKELYQRIKNEFPEMIQSKKVKVKKKLRKVSEWEKYFSFWLDKLDKAFGMPWIWDLVVVWAYPSMGKSEFNYFMARENCKNTKVAYFCLELPEKSMKSRLARNMVWISKYNRQIKNYSEHQKVRYEEKLKKLNKYDIKYLSYEERPDIIKLTKEIIDLSEQWYELFFIDNLWNIWWNNNEIERLWNISSTLRSLVWSLNICIFCLHHLWKPKGNDLFTAWWLWKFRSTQKIIDDATIVLEIFRDLDPTVKEKSYDKARVELWQYKDTFWWVTGMEDMFFDNWEYVENFIL